MILPHKFAILTLLASLTCACQSFHIIMLTSTHLQKPMADVCQISKTNERCTKTMLFNSGSNSNKSSSRERSKGVYSRPSAAIEKGSGFFVPGLEGSKVRILFGAVVLILNSINHQVSVNAKLEEVSGFALSEKIATFYGIFLLFQGLIEFAKEIGLGFNGIEDSISDSSISNDDLSGSDKKGVEQFLSSTLSGMSEDISEAARWVAATYLSLTPATHIMLIGKDAGRCETFYRLGNFGSQSIQSDEEMQLSIEAAVDTVFQSKGGRVSIPSDHPGAMLLPESSRRCVLLQQLDIGSSKQLCLLVGSDQLLTTYTKNDLKWLGLLGRYLTAKFF